MKISLPGITQEDVDYAIECIESCKQDSAKEFGFNHAYFTPGGAFYGSQWWQLDSSLALSGYKWIDREFSETSLWNFIESQKDDGRICLWGADSLPPTVAGGNALMQTEGVSSLPKLFDVTYHILQGTTDKKLKNASYNMLKKYLDWWFSNRFDQATGLISAVFEETFIPYLGFAGEYAAVDTNTEVYVGCHYIGLLAKALGKTEDVLALQKRKSKLRESINKYLWNDKKGAYYPYDIKEKRHVDCLMASTFYPLRLGIASKEQQTRLIELLQNHEHFNWDTIPLTSVSKKDPQFTTTEGIYQGNASWSGNVWTLINEMVIRGLLDCGKNQLASELVLKTLHTFKGNCAEFANPFDGNGHGVQKYAWTASQFLELIIEVIFGVSYFAERKEILISPKLPDSLKNCRLSLHNLKISSDIYLDIEKNNQNIDCSVSNNTIKIITEDLL